MGDLNHVVLTVAVLLLVFAFAPQILGMILTALLTVLLFTVWTLAMIVALGWGIFRAFRRTPPKPLTVAEARLMIRQQEIRELIARMSR
jgi:uncharacterized protein with PQ loop repeat